MPGSGKSTLAETLRRELESRGYATSSVNAPIARLSSGRHRMIKRIALAGQFAARHPTATMRAVFHLARARQRRLSELRTVILNLLSKCELVRRSSNIGDIVHISDEGVLHALWSGAYGATHPDPGRFMDMVNALLGVVPVPDVILMVDAPDSMIVDRLMQDPRRNRLGQDVARDGDRALGAARSAMALVERVLHAASYNDNSLILRISNDTVSALSTATTQAVDEIEREMTQSTRRTA